MTKTKKQYILKVTGAAALVRFHLSALAFKPLFMFLRKEMKSQRDEFDNWGFVCF